MRAWASEPAHPLMAGATIVSVGPVVCVSLSRLFPEILSGFWWAVAVVTGLVEILAIVANRRFHAS